MFADFFKLLYPRLCSACELPLVKHERFLCTNCLLELPLEPDDSGQVAGIRHKFRGKIRLEKSFAYLKYLKTGKVQRLLHQIKYKDSSELARFLGRQLGYVLREHTALPDLIVPVPLHHKKLQQRGFNQAAVIGQGVTDATGIPMERKHCQGYDIPKLKPGKANMSVGRMWPVCSKPPGPNGSGIGTCCCWTMC